MDARTVNDLWADLVRSGFFETFTYEAERRYRKSLQYLDAPKEAWMLEIGCGTGRFHHVMRKMGFRNIVSCDVTLEHIVRARELNPDGLFVVARGERLPFADSAFQAAVSNAAIEHFSFPAAGILEFSRVTEPGATVVITSDCYVWRMLQLLGLYRSKMPVDRAMPFSEFERMFKAAALEIADHDAWGVTHYLRRLDKIVPAYARRLREKAEKDDSWVNRKSGTGWIDSLRMVLLDENLFRVRNGKQAGNAIVRQRGQIDLLEVLACPVCKGPVLRSGSGGITCRACRVLFPITNGVPIMLEEQARPLSS